MKTLSPLQTIPFDSIKDIESYLDNSVNLINSSTLSIPGLKHTVDIEKLFPTKSHGVETVPAIALKEDFKEKIEEANSVENQVIVHCRFNTGFDLGPRIRIWPTTFLIPKDSGERVKLLNAINISFYPEWKNINPGKWHEFTLIFAGLPKDCTSFDLLEIIPEPGAFALYNIPRNESDIYRIELNG